MKPTTHLHTGAAALASCLAVPTHAEPPAHRVPVLTAAHLVEAPTLEDAAWDGVERHTLTLDAKATGGGAVAAEPGGFRIAWTSDALWLRFDGVDRDVVVTAGADGENLYDTGDVLEWFIGLPPEPLAGGGWAPAPYLELHAAPSGLRSAYVIRRPMLIEPSEPPFTVVASVAGPLNDAAAEGRGWSALVRLPLDALARLLPGFSVERPREAALSVLVARYNHGRHLPLRADGSGGPELTMWPVQPKTSFHLRPFHAPLRLEP